MNFFFTGRHFPSGLQRQQTSDNPQQLALPAWPDGSQGRHLLGGPEPGHRLQSLQAAQPGGSTRDGQVRTGGPEGHRHGGQAEPAAGQEQPLLRPGQRVLRPAVLLIPTGKIIKILRETFISLAPIF